MSEASFQGQTPIIPQANQTAASTIQPSFTYSAEAGEIVIRFKPQKIHFIMAQNVLKELEEEYQDNPNKEK